MQPEYEAAQRLFDRLGQAHANNGGKLHKTEWLAIAAGQFKAEFAALKKSKRLPSGRDPLFDALAEGCGLVLDQLTKEGARAVGVARADILAVTPDLSPAEISARISRYRVKYPQWVLTPSSVAKHWASLADPESREKPKFDLYREPHEWLTACVRLWGEDVGGQIHARGWLVNGTDHRAKILADLVKHQNLLD